MASRVYDSVELELQDNTAVTVVPLNIKLLRKFMVVIEAMGKAQSEDDQFKFMLDACEIALEKQIPDIAHNREKLEEALDIPTIWKILEVAGGIKMSDPKLEVEALAVDGLT